MEGPCLKHTDGLCGLPHFEPSNYDLKLRVKMHLTNSPRHWLSFSTFFLLPHLYGLLGASTDLKHPC